MKKHVFTAAMIALIGFTSCEETEDILPTEPQQNSSASTTPTFSDADAVLVGINSTTTNQGINLVIGTAVGVFYDNGNFVSAGDVSVNNNKLSRQSGNTYVFTPGILSPTGIDFSSGSNWNVAGGNGFAAFDYSYTRDFPTISAISSSETVSKSSDYTLAVNSITDSDSVIFVLGNLTHIAAANTKSHTFTVNDMSNLSTGSSVATVAPYNYLARTEGGKKVYYINESVVSKVITINN